MDGKELMARDKRLEMTGVWYSPPWWRGEPGYLDQTYCTRPEADASFGALKRVFPPRWCRSSEFRSHPFHHVFFATGESSFVELLDIGRALVLVQRHGVLAGLPERLRKPGEFTGASWELECQAELIRGGCRLRPWPADSGKRFEWICSFKNQDINIEVKHLRYETILRGVRIGAVLNASILFPPVRKHPLRSTARKLQEIEGRGPNVLIVLAPVVTNELAHACEEHLGQYPERFARLSEIFLVHPMLTVSGRDAGVAWIRNAASRAKHVSADFVNLMAKAWRDK